MDIDKQRQELVKKLAAIGIETVHDLNGNLRKKKMKDLKYWSSVGNGRKGCIVIDDNGFRFEQNNYFIGKRVT